MALVLVVDDELSFRFFLKALFEVEGHEVMTARDAREALAHVGNRLPDLITLDVMMPGRGGLAMYRTLKTHSTWKNIPVILLSGVRAGTCAHALAISGATGMFLPKPYAYLEKPPQPEHLLDLARPILAASARQGEPQETGA